MISQLPTEYDAPAPEMLTPTGAEYSFEFISKALTAVKYSLPITEKALFAHPHRSMRFAFLSRAQLSGWWATWQNTGLIAAQIGSQTRGARARSTGRK